MLFISAATMQPPATVKPAVPRAIECHCIEKSNIDSFLKNKIKYNWTLKTIFYDNYWKDACVVIEKY